MGNQQAESFLTRVLEHLPNLRDDRFDHVAWRFRDRPTNEGVGRLPRVSVDRDALVGRIMSVADYPSNLKYVEDVAVLGEGPGSITYSQHMALPLLGKLQVVITLTDYGTVDGRRVVAWGQDDTATDALDPKQGARTEYNLGAWLITDDSVAYALSSSPRKKDVGSLKFAVMTKGADAAASDLLRQNIDGMIAWSQRS